MRQFPPISYQIKIVMDFVCNGCGPVDIFMRDKPGYEQSTRVYCRECFIREKCEVCGIATKDLFVIKMIIFYMFVPNIDVKDVLISVLSHRIRLKPSVRYLETIEDYLKEQFHKNIEASKWKQELEEQESSDYR